MSVRYSHKIFPPNIYKHNQQKKYFFGKAKINGSVTLAWVAETWLTYKRTALVITRKKNKRLINCKNSQQIEVS